MYVANYIILPLYLETSFDYYGQSYCYRMVAPTTCIHVAAGSQHYVSASALNVTKKSVLRTWVSQNKKAKTYHVPASQHH